VIVLGASALFAACGSGNGGSAATAGGTSASTDGPPIASAARGVRLKRIGRFQSPVYVTSPPGDRHHLFVVEQEGRVRVITDGKVRRTPFLDIRSQVTSGGEQGLLSIAFAPDYARSGRFYVYFTDRAEEERIVEFHRASAERADPGSERLVLRMADPQPNHNGGLLLFGPDKHLYVGTGDGGGAGDQHGAHGNAQNPGSLLGKILRIDPAQSGDRPYTVPASNPFVGRAGARPEIYAYGLRNPWRFSFDRRTDDLVIGDVGQDAVEEIDFVRRGHGRGANFGWRVFEGRSRYTRGEHAPGAVPPVITRKHSADWCSITGGVVVRDPALAGLRGRYIFGDFCKGRIVSARLSAGHARSVRTTSLHVANLSSFGEDARGRVYATSLGGPVYRLVAR
jgi:glucose/arabinose dehydrogenase